MTQHEQKTALYKRPLVITLLVLFLLTASWVSYALLTFNLNDYRQQAEKQLESMLDMPVKIGQLHFNFYEANVALKVEELHVGNDETPIQIDAPSTMLSLKWLALLEKDIRFSEISLNDPEIRVRNKVTSPGSEDGQSVEPQGTIISTLLGHAAINDLEIHGGLLHLEQGVTGIGTVVVSDIDGELSDIKLGKTSQIILNGDLTLPGQTRKASWQLQGEAQPALDDRSRLAPWFNLSLYIKGLELGTLNPFIATYLADTSVAGRSDFNLQAEGDLEDISFQVGLSADRITVMPNRHYTDPVVFSNLFASGKLQSLEDSISISEISLQIDKSRLSGEITFAPAGEPFGAQVTLFNSDLEVHQLRQWLPADQDLASSLRDKLLEQGVIKLERAAFSFQPNADPPGKKWNVDTLLGEFLDLGIDVGASQPFKLNSLQFALEDGNWQIKQGQGQLEEHSVSVTGTGTFNQEGLFVTGLDIGGTIIPGELITEFQAFESPVAINGPVTFRAHTEGSPDHLTLDLESDLSQLDLSHTSGLGVSSRQGDTFSLHGTFTPGNISLDHGSIKWAFAKGHMSGSYQLDDPDSLSVDAILTIEDLSELGEILPILDKMKLHGQADLAITQRGNPGEAPPEMVLTLRDAGLRPTKYIADLNKINGRVLVTPHGLVGDRLQVYMGESPFTARAQIADFTAPVLELDVKGSAAHAKDVVFHSETAMLRDIEGRLAIDRNGLVFDKVDVRLDGGTDATVNGTITFRPPYEVRLDIESGFARISEIVDLWVGGKKAREHDQEEQPQAQKEHPKTTVLINARAKNGDLYGMKFQDASGVIIPTRERLSIHPLDFSVDKGYCNAQVIVDFPADSPPVLRISGHAEDVDALEVYQELLNQKNIVRGKLRGDFYISGEIGPNYLPSSFGEFSIEVNEGVLHQFQILSKVFSLLNVSQIFALKLPDMDTEGMPFDKLSANFHLDKGILKSDDLKIQSEAMNQAYDGQLNLLTKEIDLALHIHPLGTVDKIISRIPIAGWLLTGEDKAFLTAHFSATGNIGDVSVEVMPLDTLSDQTIGLLKRTLGLPFKLVEDPQILWGGDASKK